MREYLAAHSNIVSFVAGLIIMYIVSIIGNNEPKKIRDLKKGILLVLGTVTHKNGERYASVIFVDKYDTPLVGELPFNVLISRADPDIYKHGDLIYVNRYYY